MPQTYVAVSAQYRDATGSPALGRVVFSPRIIGAITSSILDFLVNSQVQVNLDGTGAFSVNLIATDDPSLGITGWTYQVDEHLVGVTARSYEIHIPFGSGTLDLATAPHLPYSYGEAQTDSGGGSTVTTQLITTPGSGVYAIPADATMILWDALAPGGGGGGGGTSASNTDLWGAGGGGGAGRTTKWVSAADLRAAYPGGVPYTVGAGGVGGIGATTPDSYGTNGSAGGFTFAGDFFVATPGQGGQRGGPGQLGTIPITAGVGGANGLGDTYGGFGGSGGPVVSYGTVGVAPAVDWSGTTGGLTLVGDPNFFTFEEFIQLGGGGGGGGGGGVSWDNFGAPADVPGNGGPGGFATTADPTPIFGAGGIVGGAGPTTAGVPTGVSGVASQSGGGGGAASVTGNAQAGAPGAAGSGSGGGGGGSARNGGNGGNGAAGGTGYLRITAF